MKRVKKSKSASITLCREWWPYHLNKTLASNHSIPSFSPSHRPRCELITFFILLRFFFLFWWGPNCSKIILISLCVCVFFQFLCYSVDYLSGNREKNSSFILISFIFFFVRCVGYLEFYLAVGRRKTFNPLINLFFSYSSSFPAVCKPLNHLAFRSCMCVLPIPRIRDFFNTSSTSTRLTISYAHKQETQHLPTIFNSISIPMLVDAFIFASVVISSLQFCSIELRISKSYAHIHTQTHTDTWR